MRRSSHPRWAWLELWNAPSSYQTHQEPHSLCHNPRAGRYIGLWELTLSLSLSPAQKILRAVQLLPTSNPPSLTSALSWGVLHSTQEIPPARPTLSHPSRGEAPQSLAAIRPGCRTSGVLCKPLTTLASTSSSRWSLSASHLVVPCMISAGSHIKHAQISTHPPDFIFYSRRQTNGADQVLPQAESEEKEV